MKTIRKSLIIFGLACVGVAHGEFELVTLVNAVELAPSNIILPGTVNGMVTYKPCDSECDRDFERARLTASTSFSINGKTVKFDDFRIVFADIKNAEGSYALIRVDTRTTTVASIELAR